MAFTRAKYRLLSFEWHRERCLREGVPFAGIALPGIPASEGLEKIQLSWSAKEFNFARNAIIQSQVKSGDPIIIRRREVVHAGGTFHVCEIFKDGLTGAIGELSRTEAAAFVAGAGMAEGIGGFVVNEVVAWTYEDTLASDRRRPDALDTWPAHKKAGLPDANGFYTHYHRDWCPQAIAQGYIYLVDFAGYGEVIPVP